MGIVPKGYLHWLLVAFSAAAIGSFLIITSEVQEARAGQAELIGSLDEFCENFVKERVPETVTSIAAKVTHLGSGIYLSVIGAIVVILLGWKRRWADAIQVASVGAAAALSTSLLKAYFQRPRPDSALPLAEGATYSFPSGHSVAAAAMYFTFSFILTKRIHRSATRRAIFLATCTLVTAIAISRVLLGVHFLSDIFAGSLLGVSFAALFEFVKLQLESRRN